MRWARPDTFTAEELAYLRAIMKAPAGHVPERMREFSVALLRVTERDCTSEPHMTPEGAQRVH